MSRNAKTRQLLTNKTAYPKQGYAEKLTFRLFDGKADAMPLFIYRKHYHLHDIANLQHLAGVAEAAGAYLGDVY